jgi:hypothetical protein
MAAADTVSLLQAYLQQLEDHPLRTKMLTAGTLAGSQELLASWLAKDRNKHGNYFTSRVPKMAAYGALVSAPLGHFLIWVLQKIFSGRTSLRAKIMQILVSNLIVRFPVLPSYEGDTLTNLVGRSRPSKTQSTWWPWPSSRAPRRSTRSRRRCASASGA